MNNTNQFNVTLDFQLTSGKIDKFKKIISPLIKWIDPSFQLLRTNDSEKQLFTNNHCNKNQISNGHRQETEALQVPALSVMLFLQEHGSMCAVNIQTQLKRKPWKLHHKVELHNRKMLDRPVAAQEFYSLAPDMPLWSVCPIHYGNEHFRILLHVKNFQDMMEFYRLITDMEIETSKPGFCVFQIYSQPGLDIQIALKTSDHIRPYSVSSSAILNFKVKNIENIKTFITSECKDIGNNTYSLTDPDGNCIHLSEILEKSVEEHVIGNDVSSYPEIGIKSNVKTTVVPRLKFVLQDTCDKSNCEQVIDTCKKITEDLKSFRSSDSHDSGRCSDSDMWLSEPLAPAKTTRLLQSQISGNSISSLTMCNTDPICSSDLGDSVCELNSTQLNYSQSFCNCDVNQVTMCPKVQDVYLLVDPLTNQMFGSNDLHCHSCGWLKNEPENSYSLNDGGYKDMLQYRKKKVCNYIPDQMKSETYTRQSLKQDKGEMNSVPKFSMPAVKTNHSKCDFKAVVRQYQKDGAGFNYRDAQSHSTHSIHHSDSPIYL